jgi:hypothetical protein
VNKAAKRRRPKGASPHGQFEETKAVAWALIEMSKEAEHRKTEALRAARLAQEAKTDSTDSLGKL